MNGRHTLCVIAIDPDAGLVQSLIDMLHNDPAFFYRHGSDVSLKRPSDPALMIP